STPGPPSRTSISRWPTCSGNRRPFTAGSSRSSKTPPRISSAGKPASAAAFASTRTGIIRYTPARSESGGSSALSRPRILCPRAVIRAIVDSMRASLDYDTVIIGAGISGLYQLYRLRELGQKVRVFEAGTGVGGTWYWNRYPGCRFDSESYSYGYSFNQELLDEWTWTEHFAPQPETERYLNHVADKFDLRRDIQFHSRVKAATWDEDHLAWDITLEDGQRCRARYLVTAVGPLSAPTLPRLPGVEDFRGEAYHTGLWPKHPVSFAGKRVAVVGTGATGVQVITEIAKTAG